MLEVLRSVMWSSNPFFYVTRSTNAAWLERRGGLDPAPDLRSSVCGGANVSVFSSQSVAYTPPPPRYFLLHPFKSEVSKNMTSYRDRYNSEEGKEGGELYHPAGLIEGIWDALGVRHSSSSFFHWRLYKQVSNAPDLVWQTFSKERLKGGWESDTPICFFSLSFLSSRIRSQLTPQLFHRLSLAS